MIDIAAEIDKKKLEFEKQILGIKNVGELNSLKTEYLKNFLGKMYQQLKSIEDVSKKKDFGKVINSFREFVENKIKNISEKLEENKTVANYDVSIFKRNIDIGSCHPIIKLYKKIEKIFVSMGFSVVQGPEIELDRYNFEKLNMPAHHPARDMQDTFYINAPNILLRSHTSSVQIRTMESETPPIQVISPGTVYRVDDIDPQHTPMFYQVEGLMVGEGMSFANLKAVLILFLKEVFGEETKVRFRPTYYPYTEPSAAIDMSCTECKGKGCRTCGNSGWIVVLGSGMVHPNILEGAGYDSERYTGFAFGLGLNRLALLYYGLGEIRKIYENNISLWKQL